MIAAGDVTEIEKRAAAVRLSFVRLYQVLLAMRVQFDPRETQPITIRPAPLLSVQPWARAE